MFADLFVIKKTGKYGKGVFATQFVPKGTIVSCLCRKCGTYSKEELAKLSKKKLDFVMEHEELLKSGLVTKSCDKRQWYRNHSCDSNVLGYKSDSDIAVKDIDKGEEATEDYRTFYGKSYFKRYFKNGCKCGAANCMKMKIRTQAPSKKQRRRWKKEIDAAVRAAPHVKQPLEAELLEKHRGLSYLFGK
jgi:hypothetical protein